MLQISKKDLLKQRPVQRCSSLFIDNIVRINRFHQKTKEISKTKADFLDHFIIEDHKYESFFRENETDKYKKLKKIYFKVFPEYPCELEIEEQFCFYENESLIEISLKELKSILIDEICILANKENYLNKTAKIYQSHIEEITDHKIFCQKMVFIYSLEGYLFLKMNEFLRNMNIFAFKKIKFYYISLLASFKYISEKTKFNDNKDIILYRVSKCSDEEFELYETQKKNFIFRSYKEFLSTSLNVNTPMELFSKNDADFKEFFWEITIPKELINNEHYNFADISMFSQFPEEKEILIRSGSIIQINKIIPYTETIDNQVVEFANKFKKICTLKSFSFAHLSKFISFEPSIKELNLDNYALAGDYKNMIYLKEALQMYNNIEKLKLYDNSLDMNENLMLHLTETLQFNNSIVKLILGANNLGFNKKCMIYLRELLKNNKSIREINLDHNFFGVSEENNMVHLNEGLMMNESIQSLSLRNNFIGLYEKNLTEFIEALLKNKSIKKINIHENKLKDHHKKFIKNRLEKLKINEHGQYDTFDLKYWQGNDHNLKKFKKVLSNLLPSNISN